MNCARTVSSSVRREARVLVQQRLPALEVGRELLAAALDLVEARRAQHLDDDETV